MSPAQSEENPMLSQITDFSVLANHVHKADLVEALQEWPKWGAMILMSFPQFFDAVDAVMIASAIEAGGASDEFLHDLEEYIVNGGIEVVECTEPYDPMGMWERIEEASKDGDDKYEENLARLAVEFPVTSTPYTIAKYTRENAAGVLLECGWITDPRCAVIAARLQSALDAANPNPPKAW